MPRIENTVFLSYRRTNVAWALAIFQSLTHHGYEVFLDYDGIGCGNFEQAILDNIRSRAHFIVLLTPTALEESQRPDDWLRREIETALDLERNIVPLLLEGFDFRSPSIAGQLTGRLAALTRYNALEVPAGFFDEAMTRLRNMFLNVPADVVIHQASPSGKQVAANQKAAAAAAAPVPPHELAAQAHFERAYGTSDILAKLKHLNDALRLKPDYNDALRLRRLLWRTLSVRIASAGVGLLVLVIFLGWLNTQAFNLTLGTNDFASDTPWDWWVWGRRTSLPPLMILAVVAVPSAVVVGVLRGLRAYSSVAKRCGEVMHVHLTRTVHRLHCDDIMVLASGVLLMSVILVSSAVFYYLPLIKAAVLTDVSNDVPERLAILSPDFVDYHNEYRVVLTLLVVASAALWYPVVRLRAQGQRLPAVIGLAGLVVMLFSLVLLHLPYRLLYWNAFDVVTWNGARCYVIGSRNAETLLSCPEFSPPRNRRINETRDKIIPLGIKENIFTLFGHGVHPSRTSVSRSPASD
jgi:hypothetical protein